MFFENATIDIVTRGVVLSLLAMMWVIALVRVLGLRSFSKMTAFDFVMTIATGSLLAGAAQSTDWAGFMQSMIAMAGLFMFQFLAASARKHSQVAEFVLQNEPVFLMRNGRMIDEALNQTRVKASDVYAKLREANALKLADVHAVVLETTGDISVLHGGSAPDACVIEDVRQHASSASQ
ncbi:DUF421 domain-containing protein [Erythrobacter sp. R86502]|uniref:DUF421 domain-containing protein n=1 Tax=Erythrobacter sp. R86502 TaxID=3093846 RepID=UPI0036D2CE4D